MINFNNEIAIINKQDYALSFNQENIELIIYSTICFAIPFLIGHPQWIVGIIVNTALVLAALNLKFKMILPIITLPSIAVLTKGLIFGSFTHLLLLMIPFIWISNTILVYSFKKLNLEKKINKIKVLVIGSIAKTIFLFSISFIFYKIGILPGIFLTSMGIIQFYTAITGGAIALGIHSAKKRLSTKED